MNTLKRLVLSLVAVGAVFAGSPLIAGPPSESEADLLAILGSDAAPAEKAITCKKLAVVGTDAAVPALAKLLSDPELASWSRIALEAIAGSKSEQALLEATSSLEGKLLVGVINSIGVLEVSGATSTLAGFLNSDDPQVVEAAAVAIGHIGEKDGPKALLAALAATSGKVKSEVAEGCVLCAFELHASGDKDSAIELFEAVRKADVSKQRTIEATRGTILARGDAGIPILVEQLRSDDRDMFRLALGVARECTGSAVDQALVAELGSASPAKSAAIVLVLADRPKSGSLPAIIAAAEKGPKPVQVAALKSLASIGDSTTVKPLFGLATGDDADLAALAKDALAEIEGDDVDSYIVDVLKSSKGDLFGVAIEIVGRRRIDATEPLLATLRSSDAEARKAALVALGETVSQEKLSVLIDQAIDSASVDQPVALKALYSASVRMPDREACATALAAEMEKIDNVDTKVELLKIIGAVAGGRALAVVGAAANGDEEKLQDMASQLLGKWATADAAAPLLELANDDSAGKYQIRGVRGYIRIVRQLPMKQAQRNAMCQKAWQVAKRAAEQEMVLEVLERYPSAANLKLANEAKKVEGLEAAATKVADEIAKKIGKGT